MFCNSTRNIIHSTHWQRRSAAPFTYKSLRLCAALQPQIYFLTSKSFLPENWYPLIVVTLCKGLGVRLASWCPSTVATHNLQQHPDSCSKSAPGDGGNSYFAHASQQSFLFRRNIGLLTLKIIYFHYLKNSFLDQSTQKRFYLISKKQTLFDSQASERQ